MRNKKRCLEILARCVAGGATVRDAAATAQCSEASAYQLSQTGEFRQRVNELRTIATDMAVGRLSHLATMACDVLGEVLSDDSARASARVAAAKAVLSMLMPFTELNELRGRIDALELAQQQAEQDREAA